MRTVIFDLDGTLVDSAADLIAAANACFEGRGLGTPLHPVHDAATAFRGGRAMLRLGFERVMPGWSEADVSADYPRLLHFYREEIDTHTRPYPGATAAVEALRSAGYVTGICTNKPEALAEILLTRLNMRGLFDALVGADTLPVRKPDAAPYLATVERAGGRLAQSLLIGDTDTDRRTARAAGVPCALVTFGPEGRAVANLDPEALLDDYDQLGTVVARLIG